MKLLQLAGFCLAASLSAGAWAQNATLTRNSDLKDKPFIDAATIAQLPRGTAVQLVESKGGWSQVKAEGQPQGWVRLLNVRPDTQAATAGGVLQGLNTLGNVVRTGSSGTTATTGAKGISQDELQNAVPDAKAVASLAKYVATTQNAERHAARNRLKRQTVPYLNSKDEAYLGADQ